MLFDFLNHITQGAKSQMPELLFFYFNSVADPIGLHCDQPQGNNRHDQNQYPDKLFAHDTKILAKGQDMLMLNTF